MSIMMRARDIPADLLEFFEPVGAGAPDFIKWAPEPLKEGHYAAFPRWLPRLAIQAGTSERGCCPGCGAPWLRVISTRYEPHGDSAKSQVKTTYGERTSGDTDKGKFRPQEMPYGRASKIETTEGWRPSCACGVGQPAVPATVLDCFGGSGTTGIEANALGRHAVLCELQEKYVAIAHKRLSREPVSLFAWQEEAAGG